MLLMIAEAKMLLQRRANKRGESAQSEGQKETALNGAILFSLLLLRIEGKSNQPFYLQNFISIRKQGKSSLL